MKKLTHRSSGFTLVELLIAVVIIGILVTIIVPVLSNRASDARIAATQTDLDTLANAQSQIALDTGYLVRLHVIDDSGAASDLLGPTDPLDVIDTILDEDQNIAPNQTLIFIDTREQFILGNTTLFDRVQDNAEAFGWKGPYANFPKKVTAGSTVSDYTFGQPLDPWGNPYLLLGKQGLIAESPTNHTARGAVVNGTVTINGEPSPTLVFDRPTVLSLGPDGVPGSAGIVNNRFGLGDDLYRQF